MSTGAPKIVTAAPVQTEVVQQQQVVMQPVPVVTGAAQTVVVQQPVAGNGQIMMVSTQGMYLSSATCGRIPVAGVCPLCKQQTVTQVHYEPGGATWGACLGLSLVGCWLGCCLIPFCVDDAKDAHHYCSACQQKIAIRSPCN